MNEIAKAARQKLLEEIYAMTDDKLIDFIQELQSRLSAAENERGEANAYAAMMRSALDRLEGLGQVIGEHEWLPIYDAITATKPAALSHLRQEIRREAMEEAKRLCQAQEAQWSGSASHYDNGALKACMALGEAIGRLAEEAKEQEGKDG